MRSTAVGLGNRASSSSSETGFTPFVLSAWRRGSTGIHSSFDTGTGAFVADPLEATIGRDRREFDRAAADRLMMGELQGLDRKRERGMNPAHCVEQWQQQGLSQRVGLNQGPEIISC